MARQHLERTHAAPPVQASQTGDRLLPAYVLAGVILVIGIPTAVAIGVSWVRFSEPTLAGRPTPNWVRSETVRATTSNGDSVKAQVAIDASDRTTRAALEGNRTQVALLLQISLGAHDRRTLQGAGGMQRLSKDMAQRLNAFLDSHHAAPVREVIIQELFFSKV